METNSHKNLVKELEVVSQFFAVLFEYPNPAILSYFTNDKILVKDLCKISNTEFLSFRSLTYRDLEIAYNSLFIVEPTKNGAVLYESYYASPEKMLNQESSRQIKKLVEAENGFVSENSPADYLPVILSLLNLYCEKFLETNEQNYFHKIVFLLENHVFNWMEKFTFDVLRHSNVFYGFIANLYYNYFQLVKSNLEELRKIK
ncbi:molecular chaperone TorD family protein [bacterium]|nr:molecular chaperone TorD family protein [bacterium]